MSTRAAASSQQQLAKRTTPLRSTSTIITTPRAPKKATRPRPTPITNGAGGGDRIVPRSLTAFFNRNNNNAPRVRTADANNADDLESFVETILRILDRVLELVLRYPILGINSQPLTLERIGMHLAKRLRVALFTHAFGGVDPSGNKRDLAMQLFWKEVHAIADAKLRGTNEGYRTQMKKMLVGMQRTSMILVRGKPIQSMFGPSLLNIQIRKAIRAVNNYLA
jgi:hypothetical protein